MNQTSGMSYGAITHAPARTAANNQVNDIIQRSLTNMHVPSSLPKPGGKGHRFGTAFPERDNCEPIRYSEGPAYVHDTAAKLMQHLKQPKKGNDNGKKKKYGK